MLEIGFLKMPFLPFRRYFFVWRRGVVFLASREGVVYFGRIGYFATFLH